MAQHRIPEFLLHLPREEQARLMKRYRTWKSDEVAEIMVSHYQKKLDQLFLEEERESPLSWFDSKWKRVKRLGQRETLRKLINDLKA